VTILTFAVNDKNDFYLNSIGNLAFAYDLTAILQQCEQAAKTLLGEMVYHTNDGLPYFQTLWVGVPNIAQYTSALRRAFVSVGGVLEVVSLLTSQGADNDLSYTAIIRTIYGTGTAVDTIAPV
jgi:hypothetical protein